MEINIDLTYEQLGILINALNVKDGECCLSSDELNLKFLLENLYEEMKFNKVKPILKSLYNYDISNQYQDQLDELCELLGVTVQ